MGRRKVRTPHRRPCRWDGNDARAGRASAETATASPIPWGLYQASDNLQYSLGSSVPNYGLEYYSWTSSGTEPFDVTSANAAYNNNVEPFVELQPCTSPCTASGGGGYSLVDIATACTIVAQRVQLGGSVLGHPLS